VYDEIQAIPQGFFWLMGISATTGVGARSIASVGTLNQAAPQPGGPISVTAAEVANAPVAGTDPPKPVISLHRIQLVIWTLILVMLFIVDLYENIRFPEVPEGLLVLLGISGGTYLGFKFPERS
jgi:hypothetical protein